MQVYNYIPIFHFIANVCSAHTPFSLMLLFNSYVGYADYKKKLFSKHFYTNYALK